jgi:para-nitrobenzyl esterase
MVWIHGGAFQFGESNDYDPRALVGKNVVVVSINYRLGALGFLAHPALTAEGGGTSGNYGFLDQQAALRWVKRNIARFGGNPNNVTIFGQSAGGLSVHTHLAAPGSTGLFQQAIAQSGAYMLAPPTVAVAETQGTAYATAVGCSSQDAACLRAVPVTTLLANQPTSPVAYLPRVDGIILPQAMDAAFTSGQFNKVPVIEGSTHDEYRLFVATFFTFQGIPVNATTYPGLIAAILQLTPAQAQVVVPLVMAQYPLANYSSGELALAAVGTDSTFACNAIRATSLLSPFTPTWSYEFDDPDAPMIYIPPAPFDYGAYHGSELPYLFDMRINAGVPVPSPLLNQAQQQLSNSMVLYWSRFALLGNPNAPLQTTLWPRFLPPLSQNVQLLVPPQPQNYTATAFLADHKCSFWQQLAGG